METANVRDFGAAGNGIQDDFPYLQLALEKGERRVIIPAGRCRVSGTLKVSCDTEIAADKEADIFVCEKLPEKRGDFLIANADHINGNENI